MSKLDAKPMQSAQLSQTPHNLSHTFDFTSSTGMILPLVFDVLNPGEKIESIVDLSDTRTQPMQSAAYLDLDMHVDYFFVPMTIMMSKFESFIYRIKDFYSTGGSYGQGPTSLPLLDLDLVKSAIRNNAITPLYNNPDFDDIGKGAIRLFDHLRYGDLFSDSYGDSSRFGNPDYAYNPSIFPFALLAYNAAYEYYFINDEFEEFQNKLFNVDLFVNGGTNITDLPSVFPMFYLKYRNKYHDYFTSLKASPIVSGKNLLDSAGSLSLAKSWLSRDNTWNLVNGSIVTLLDGHYGSGPGYNDSPELVNSTDTRTNFGFNAGSTLRVNPQLNEQYVTPNGADVNTANLRALFANEKLWTITGMNRKQYDAQTLAHYGYDVPVDVMHSVQRIGHHVYNLKVGEVISTAGTATQPLATVAGKGYAFRNDENKPIIFTAPCHGVFIALYSSAIKRNYCGTFDKVNAIAGWQDFYQPEFDHLGMQPIFGFEASQNSLSSNQSRTSTSNPYANILGWQYRYEQFKRKYNYSTLAFSNSYDGSRFTDYIAPFGTWSPADLPLKNTIESSISMAFQPNVGYLADLKENPCELNNMMQIPYDPWYYNGNTTGRANMDYAEEPWLAYQTDPLIHHSLIHYTKLSTMSAYSMPRLES